MKRNSLIHKEMRISTVMKVLDSIRDGARSKNEIMKMSGLSWGSCSEIIKMLIEIKLVRSFKIDYGDHDRAGRKATGYYFNTKSFLLVGMELKARSASCSLVNLGNIELHRKEYPILSLTNRNIYQQISSVFIRFMIDSGVKTEDLLGLSISLTGAVDPVKKRLIFSPRYKSLENVDFSLLEELLPSVYSLNIDHDIIAQSSSVMDKNGWNFDNYAFIHIGEGVGMISFDKDYYKGGRGFAGEVGHIPFEGFDKERLCSCGKKNCYEAFLSSDGIRGIVEEITGIKPESIKNLDKAVLTDNRVVSFVTNALSSMILIVSNILDPGVIIIGGESIEPFIPLVKDEVELRLRHEAWMGGSREIKWYSHTDINCAYGTIINASGQILEKYIKQKLI